MSAAYTGRVAIAYQTGQAFHRSTGSSSDPSQRYINLCLAIYECESSGGSEWILEDTVYLKNIELQPSIPQMDMSVYNSCDQPKTFPFGGNRLAFLLYQANLVHVMNVCDAVSVKQCRVCRPCKVSKNTLKRWATRRRLVLLSVW